VNGENPFEDWWIHPSAFSSQQLAILQSLKLNDMKYEHIIDILREEFVD
jgi:hypothetical protein